VLIVSSPLKAGKNTTSNCTPTGLLNAPSGVLTALNGPAKKEEDDPFGSGRKRRKRIFSDRLKKSHFKTASRKAVGEG